MTREEAIKRLETHIAYHQCGEWPFTKTDEAMEMAISALREQPRWISVEERLPQLHETALCFKDGRMKIGIYMGVKYTDNVAAFRDFQNGFGFGVTHWMPLPGPPKEEV